MLVLLTLVLAAQAPRLTYVPASRSPDKQAQFTRYGPRDQVYVAAPRSNLREKPDGNAALLCELDMGAPVKVLASVGAPVEISQRTDVWYQVEAGCPDGKATRGHLFGATLTPLRLLEDLNGDGVREVITVAIGWDAKARIRVSNPAEPDPTKAVQQVLEATSVPDPVRTSDVTLSFVPASQAGVPLILHEFHSTMRDGYNVWWFYYFSFTSRGAGQQPQLRPALSTYRNDEVNRPVRFDPTNRRASVGTAPGVDEYTLQDGVFVWSPPVRSAPSP